MYNSVILSSENEIVAFVKTDLKSGASVKYSTQISKEALNADREFNLINASAGRISKAKKYLNANVEASHCVGKVEESNFYLI